MTGEEAKKIIFSQWQSFLEHNIDYGGISEAYKMAMEALDRQLSDDCISREDAIRVAEQGQIQGYEWQFKKLCTLPPVTPQANKGKWIEYCYQNLSCSNCGYIVADTDIDECKYCPNCGAEMEIENEKETC